MQAGTRFTYPGGMEGLVDLSLYCKGKGKVDHDRMGVGGVLISLTLAVSP